MKKLEVGDIFITEATEDNKMINHSYLISQTFDCEYINIIDLECDAICYEWDDVIFNENFEDEIIFILTEVEEKITKIISKNEWYQTLNKLF